MISGDYIFLSLRERETERQKERERERERERNRDYKVLVTRVTDNNGFVDLRDQRGLTAGYSRR